jgi:hypothetical protein
MAIMVNVGGSLTHVVPATTASELIFVGRAPTEVFGGAGIDRSLTSL